MVIYASKKCGPNKERKLTDASTLLKQGDRRLGAVSHFPRFPVVEQVNYASACGNRHSEEGDTCDPPRGWRLSRVLAYVTRSTIPEENKGVLVVITE